MFSSSSSSPKQRRSSVVATALTALVWVAAAACGNAPSRMSAGTNPLQVDWTDSELMVNSGPWTIRRCDSRVVALCVDLREVPVGHVLVEDVPTTAPAGVTSGAQIHATLAVRTQTLYQLLERHRSERCGPGYQLNTALPRQVPAAGASGLKYEATGSREGVIMERTVGYRLYRSGIETLIEATAIEPDTCLIPDPPTFTVQQLESFEPLLDRIVAGSILPEPTVFADLPIQPGGSQDPRITRAPTNGIGISHRLGS